MKFLKKIFGLNGRLDRRGYLLFGVFPIIGFIFLLNTFHSLETTIVAVISFIPLFILAFISAVKRGRDSGLNSFVTLLLFGAIPILVIVLSEKFRINLLFMACIVYLLLMPSSSKELKVIGKVEYFIIIMVAIIPPIVFVSFALESIARTKYKINKTMISLTCVIIDANAEAIKMFKLDNGVYPTTAEGLNALVSNPNVLKYPNTPYYKKPLKDVWGLPIIYVKTKDGFELISYGADKKKGGKDEGADILYSKCQRR